MHMKNITNIASLVFIAMIVLLTGLSVLAVWGFVDGSILSKSFSTIGLMGVVSFVIIVADKFIEHNDAGENLVQDGFTPGVIVQPAHIFSVMRIITVAILICAAVLLGFVGVLAIWDVLGSQVLYRSVSSIAIICFSSVTIILTCLNREKNQ